MKNCNEEQIKQSMDKMFNPATDRDLYLMGAVTNNTMGDLIKKIDMINNWYIKASEEYMVNASAIFETISVLGDNPENVKLELAPLPTDPITLHISSYGGYIYDGIGLINVMKNSIVPIQTIVEGHAMSMGFIIALCGEHRMSYKNSTFMYHEGSGWNIGNFTDQKQSIKQCDILQKTLDELTVEHTNISQETLEKIKEAKQDWYFNGEKALELGVIDELIDGEEISEETIDKQ